MISLKWITERVASPFLFSKYFKEKTINFKKKKIIKTNDICRMAFDSVKFHGTNMLSDVVIGK